MTGDNRCPLIYFGVRAVRNISFVILCYYSVSISKNNLFLGYFILCQSILMFGANIIVEDSVELELSLVTKDPMSSGIPGNLGQLIDSARSLFQKYVWLIDLGFYGVEILLTCLLVQGFYIIESVHVTVKWTKCNMWHNHRIWTKCMSHIHMHRKHIHMHLVLYLFF